MLVIGSGAARDAAEPWVEQVVHGAVGSNAASKVRPVKGSRLAACKFWQSLQAYLPQNDDKRLIFASSDKGGARLTGTTSIPYKGCAKDVFVADNERDYLLHAVGPI